MMADLTIKGLTKRFGSVTAVENLNLQVKDKEFAVLVGPSGCGKTTTLNAIAGLLEIDEGEIWFGEELVTAAKRGISKVPQKRGVAMVFQDYAIYPHMTVFGNIAFPLEIRKVARSEIEARVRKTAKLLQIENLLDRKPSALSGGQRQRIALGRAMVREAKVFLMDEPLANLDAELRVHARIELKKLQQELGITTIFVTHDQIEAMTMGDRIAVMHEGYLVQMGTPAGLYDSPRDIFVARFIGSPPMNMLNGELVKQNKGMAIDLGFFVYPLSKTFRGASEGKKVVLGVRPEKIALSTEKSANAFQARIIYIELVGKESNVHLEAGENHLIAISSSTKDLKNGDTMWLSFDEEATYVFDRSTGKRYLDVGEDHDYSQEDSSSNN
jgi:multiple sugar transport system ATP-binding protein